MSNVLLFIDGVNRTEYFKPPLRVNPGGDGVIGNATIILEQEAGGLDIRPMMDVRVYVPFNTTTNAGVAAKGRLFGGVVAKRATTNNGTTKKWTLPCWDYNIILKKSYRRASSVNAVTLMADTLDDQIQELFDILQGAIPTVPINVTDGVALTTSMPAVSYPGGHRWEWYLQSLLRQAHIEDPSVFPSYYMAPNIGFGALENFGTPVLWVYDGANPPLSSVAFSDTPTGAEKDVFEYLTRDTDATALGQTQQSWWSGLVFSAEDTASIAAYPNIYDDSGTGWVDGEVINDTTSANADEAQAAVDALVAAKGAPRDGFKWVTYERLIPGEYVDLKWDLEGIPSMTQYRVAAATFEWEEPNVIKTTLTINTRRLGLFDDGTTGFFAPPIEGDDVPPLPASDFTVASNVYNQATGEADVTFDIDNTGGSPDTAGYKIIGGPTSAEVETFDVGLNLAPEFSLRPGISYSFRVVAYDNSGNQSETFPAPGDPALIFTTAAVFIEPPTGFQIDTAKGEVPNGYDWADGSYAFPYFKWTAAAIEPDTYLVSVWLTSTPVGTRRDFTVPGSTVDMRWPWSQRVGLGWTGQAVAMVGTTPSTASSTTFTPPAYVPAPPTSLQIDTTRGDVPNGYVWPTDYTVYAWLKWVAPVAPPTPPDPTNYRLTIYPTGFPAQAVHHNLSSLPLYHLWTHSPLYVGVGYTAEITAWKNGLPSTAATTTFTPPVWPGGVAPVIGSVSHGISNGEYYLRIPLTHSGDHSGGGWINVSNVGGFERNHAIPRNVPWPYTGIVKGFVPEVLYTIEVFVFDAQMRQSPSDTETYTIHTVPGNDRLHPGWDSFSSAYDEATRGLEDVGTSGTYVFDDTTLYAGNSTLKLSAVGGTVSVILPEHYAEQEFDISAVSIAIMEGGGGSDTATVEWIHYDDTDTPIGSPDPIFNGIPSGAFALTDIPVGPAPATAVYARIKIGVTTGFAAGDVWFSRPIVSPQVPSAGIKDGAVSTPQLAANAVTPAKTFFQASFVAPLPFPDENGDPVVGLWWSDGDETLYFGPLTNPTYGDPGFGYLDGTGAIFRVKNGIMSYSGNLEIVGTSVLGSLINDPSADGYTYLPQISAPPTGTPTVHTGSVPAAVELVPFGTPVLWLYDANTASWHSITSV